MIFLTLGEAEKEVGVTKSTISRAIKDGRMSANRNENGHYQIDPAELFRVYPPTRERGQDDEQEQRNPSRNTCLLYTSPSPRDATLSRMPSSA